MTTMMSHRLSHLILTPNPACTPYDCALRSGQTYRYGHPEDLDVLHPNDIVWNLAHQRRYQGMIDESVLEHIVLGIRLGRLRGMSSYHLAWFAIHDLHEAYMPDLPRFLKRTLPALIDLEHVWERRMRSDLHFPDMELPPEVLALDRLAVQVEVRAWKHPAAHNFNRIYLEDEEATPADIQAARELTRSPAEAWAIIDTCLRVIAEGGLDTGLPYLPLAAHWNAKLSPEVRALTWKEMP